MPRSQSLLPREHGVYAELAFPITTGLILGGLGLASVAFAATVVLAVLAHEPFAILSGRRGVRLESALRHRARGRLFVLVPVTIATGIIALALSPGAARLSTSVPAGFALLLLPAILGGREKTLWAELTVVAALAASLLPVAMAGGVDWASGLVASAVWLASFALGTVSVHAVKARHKKASEKLWITTVAPVCALGVIGVGLIGAWKNLVTPAIVVALLPPVVVALAVSIARVHPRHLRTVGWSLVTANTVTLAALLYAL